MKHGVQIIWNVVSNKPSLCHTWSETSGSFEPYHEKTCLRDFLPGPTQRLEIWDLGRRGIVLNKGTDQLLSYCAADLQLCLSYAKSRFSYATTHLCRLQQDNRRLADTAARAYVTLLTHLSGIVEIQRPNIEFIDSSKRVLKAK